MNNPYTDSVNDIYIDNAENTENTDNTDNTNNTENKNEIQLNYVL